MSSTVLPCLHTHTQFGCCCALHLLPEWLIFIYLFRIFGADMNKKKLLNFRCFSPKYASFGSLLPWFRLYTYNYPVYFLCLRVFNLLWAILLMLYQVIGCEIQTAANHTHTPNKCDSKQLGKSLMFEYFPFFFVGVFIFEVYLCVFVCHSFQFLALSLSHCERIQKSINIGAPDIFISLSPTRVYRLTPYQQISNRSVQQTPKTMLWKIYSVRWPTIKWRLAGPNWSKFWINHCAMVNQNL